MNEEEKSKSPGGKIDRRDFLQGLAGLPVIGAFALAALKQESYRRAARARKAAAAEGGEAPAELRIALLGVGAQGDVLLNAMLITTLGFILSCTLCYVLAVQGLRRAAHQPGANSPRVWATDVLTGALISAPVFWMFTQFLAINLPGLTSTGWL